MLHDIGKLHVPDRIILKPGPLTPDEWEIVRSHTVHGDEILGDCEGFETARRVARWHHENVDGSGYPDRLRGTEIPLEARIVRIADAFDAMTNDRPYSRARSAEDALDELDRYRGLQFDPELVRLMEQLIRSGNLLALLGAPTVIDGLRSPRVRPAGLAPEQRALEPFDDRDWSPRPAPALR
jgi:putative two-component system response regulator